MQVPEFARSFALAIVLLLAAGPAAAQAERWATDGRNLALKGYDPVAYFTENRPTEGSAQFETEWDGAKWRFASAANRDRFIAEPERFAPQFGGFCIFMLASGKVIEGDPTAWTIIDGKLFINMSHGARDKWRASSEDLIARAETNWQLQRATR